MLGFKFNPEFIMSLSLKVKGISFLLNIYWLFNETVAASPGRINRLILKYITQKISVHTAWTHQKQDINNIARSDPCITFFDLIESAGQIRHFYFRNKSNRSCLEMIRGDFVSACMWAMFSGVGLGFGWEFLVKAAVEDGSGDSGFC